jgi:hypothetical protein
MPRYSKKHVKPIASGPLHPQPVTDTVHLYRKSGRTWCGELAEMVPHTEVDDHCTCLQCISELQDYIDSYEMFH